MKKNRQNFDRNLSGAFNLATTVALGREFFISAVTSLVNFELSWFDSAIRQ